MAADLIYKEIVSKKYDLYFKEDVEANLLFILKQKYKKYGL